MKNLIINLEGIFCKEYEESLYNGITMVYKDFPILNQIPIRIRIQKITGRKEKSLAIVQPIVNENKVIYSIILNEEAFKYQNIQDKIDEIKYSYEAFYYDIPYIIAHELGHILHNCYVASKLKMPIELSLHKFFFRWIIDEKIQQKYLGKLKTHAFQKAGYLESDCINCFGKNSLLGCYEFVAECFNNYYYLRNMDSFSSEAEKAAFQISEIVVHSIKEYLE